MAPDSLSSNMVKHCQGSILVVCSGRFSERYVNSSSATGMSHLALGKLETNTIIPITMSMPNLSGQSSLDMNGTWLNRSINGRFLPAINPSPNPIDSVPTQNNCLSLDHRDHPPATATSIQMIET